MKTTLLSVVVAAAVHVYASGCAMADAPGPGEPTLAQVRAATEKYQDVNVALAEGYIRDPSDMCETADMMGRPAADGAMGVHYFRPDLLGITAPPNPRVSGNGTYTDFNAPSILIYERGEALKAHCDGLLRKAEARVEKISLNQNGQPTGTEPLDVED